jgi:hypothetical protein
VGDPSRKEHRHDDEDDIYYFDLRILRTVRRDLRKLVRRIRERRQTRRADRS